MAGELYNLEGIKHRRKNIFVSSDLKQESEIVCKPDVDGNSFGLYLCAHAVDKTNHIFYLDDVAETEEENFKAPVVPESWVLHRVPIAKDASGSAIATSLTTVVNSVAGKFAATATGKRVRFKLAVKGYAPAVRDALVAAKRTGFSFRLINVGLSRVAIGAMEGDVEIGGLQTTNTEVQIHQKGETPVASSVSGYETPTVSFAGYETDKEALKRFFVMIGAQTMIPEIEDAEETIGYGPTLIGSQKPTFKVEVVPEDADEADKSDNWTLWKVAFDIESMTFAATELATVPLSGSLFPDLRQLGMNQYFVVGDATPYEIQEV